jgi:hypothetical protein
VVQKYLSELRRDSLYRQLRTAACTTDADQQTMEDAIDVALMTFGAWRWDTKPAEAGTWSRRATPADHSCTPWSSFIGGAGVGVIRTVGSEIDRIEGELKRLVPGLQYVDLVRGPARAGVLNWRHGRPEFLAHQPAVWSGHPVNALWFLVQETDKGATGMSLLGSLDLPGLHPSFDLEAVRKLYPRQHEVEASQKSAKPSSNSGGQVA